MSTRIRGTFVLSWAQVELEGVAAAPVDLLRLGAAWMWRGQALRVDGPADVLMLGRTPEDEALHDHAARAIDAVIDRVVGRPDCGRGRPRRTDPDIPLLDHGFSVTDGRRRYNASLVERPDGPPLCVFPDELPPPERELWVSHVQHGSPTRRRTGATPEVICFTPDVMIDTPTGRRPVATLAEGDLVQTMDDGPQPIRWIGRRKMTGARLYAMPSLRPIRICAGADGEGRPDRDLLVSPGHRLLIRGPLARGLFNTDEVLVAAEDLLNDRTIRIDRRLREVTYVHLLLDRHGIVFANGVETESFHPGSMDLAAMDPDQIAALDARVPGVADAPGSYGGFARRMLSRSEASILRHAAHRGH